MAALGQIVHPSLCLPAFCTAASRNGGRGSIVHHQVLYWYKSHDRVVASEYWAKIHMTLDAVRLNRPMESSFGVITPVVTSEEDAERDAVMFVQTLFPLLGQYLPS